MFSFLSGLLSRADDYGRWPMMGWDQSSEAAARGPVWGYGHMLPTMMGWGWGDGGSLSYLGLAFSLVIQVLLVALLLALLRWLWKKGN